MSADSTLLLALVAVASVPFVTQLGFYSDDWALLSAFHFSGDRSLQGLVRAVWKHCDTRPVQAIYYSCLYLLFGQEPLGYHVTNLVVWVMATVLAYLALVQLRLPRWAAMAIAGLYATVPSVSTARFWFAAFAAPMSIALYLISLNIDLWSATRRGAALHLSRACAVALLIASVLTYEVAMPLFLANPIFAWYRARAEGCRWTRGRWITFLAVNLLALVLLGAYKAGYSPRLNAPRGLVAQVLDLTAAAVATSWREGDYGFNLWGALSVHLGTFGAGLLFAASSVAQYGLTRDQVAAALAAGVLLGLGVWWHSRREEWLTPRRWIAILAAGLCVFIGGYTIFLTTRSIQIVSTGPGNRTGVAAALGAAIVVVAVCGLFVGALRRPPWRAAIVALLIGAQAAAGTLTLAAIGRFWSQSYVRQLQVLSVIRRDVPSLPAGGTLILDGVCPYEGPAIVFESSWDLAGALQLAYGDPALTADSTRSMQPGPKGVVTSLYDDDFVYPYGHELIVFDLVSKRTTPLVDRETAVAYLRDAIARRPLCAAGKEGQGVPILPR